jgi:hypothetical protein
MNRLRKFLRLSSADRRLLISAALLLGMIKLGLWLLSFQNLRRLLGRLSRRPTGMWNADHSFSDRITWAVMRAGRYVPGARTCLPQALAVQVLLARRDCPAHLCIGVAKGEAGQMEAHAWVESHGRIVIGGSGLERYIPLSDISFFEAKSVQKKQKV